VTKPQNMIVFLGENHTRHVTGAYGHPMVRTPSIDRIARERPCETQEYLLSRIARACASYPQITGLDICLRKRPVLRGTGSLGVRLRLGPAQLAGLRDAA